MATTEIDFVILGAGVTGLSAAMELKEPALIIEKESKAGGLVRTHCFNNGYWFDHVLHLLHFKDNIIQHRITSLMGDVLQPCPPTAWIECSAGTVLYPFQLNLGALNNEVKKQCINDYISAFFATDYEKELKDYRQYLLSVFGNAMCEVFYFPYNEKMYKYPLEKITADSIIWNLHKPSIEEILDGSFNPNCVKETYNTNAFYPRPPVESPVRGMEVLVQSLAARANYLELNAEIVHIETESRVVHFMKKGILHKIRYNSSCLSTIPLPKLMHLCSNVSEDLLKMVDRLIYTKVYSIAMCIKGERPLNTGHWRYYTNPEIPFTRLIFMTAFDADNAPQDGWGLLAEITCASTEEPDMVELIHKTINAVKTLGYINSRQEIIGTYIWPVEFAYVIFTEDTNEIVKSCSAFLERCGISVAGRYGKWQYSSIYQNIKEGFEWAQKVSEKTST